MKTKNKPAKSNETDYQKELKKHQKATSGISAIVPKNKPKFY